jgi:hypothetical protein
LPVLFEQDLLEPVLFEQDLLKPVLFEQVPLPASVIA